jgi:hypothetical protein
VSGGFFCCPPGGKWQDGARKSKWSSFFCSTSLFNEGNLVEWLDDLNITTLAMLIPIVAIIVGGVIAITKAFLHHRERIAMIQKGMHPDYPPGEPPQDPGEEEAGGDPEARY